MHFIEKDWNKCFFLRLVYLGRLRATFFDWFVTTEKFTAFSCARTLKSIIVIKMNCLNLLKYESNITIDNGQILNLFLTWLGLSGCFLKAYVEKYSTVITTNLTELSVASTRRKLLKTRLLSKNIASIQIQVAIYD